MKIIIILLLLFSFNSYQIFEYISQNYKNGEAYDDFRIKFNSREQYFRVDYNDRYRQRYQYLTDEELRLIGVPEFDILSMSLNMVLYPQKKNWIDDSVPRHNQTVWYIRLDNSKTYFGNVDADIKIIYSDIIFYEQVMKYCMDKYFND